MEESGPDPAPGSSLEDHDMNVTCPNCSTVYRVDPAKVPEAGVRARCAVCSAMFAVRRESAARLEPVHQPRPEPARAEPVRTAAPPPAAAPPRPAPAPPAATPATPSAPVPPASAAAPPRPFAPPRPASP